MNTRAPGFNADDEPWDAFGDEPQEDDTVNDLVNATPGPWEVCEFSADHADALPGEVGVYAPTHPDSYIKEDGTWHGVTICRGMTGPAKHDNATLIACTPELLEAVKLAYLKHHMGYDSIGWDELSETLHNALNNAMGSKGYLEWVATK